MQVILLSPFEFEYYRRVGELAYDNLGRVPVQKYVRQWSDVFPGASNMDHGQMRGCVAKHLEQQLLSCRTLLPEQGFRRRGDVLDIFLERDDGSLVLLEPDQDEKLQPGGGKHKKLFAVCSFLVSDSDNLKWWDAAFR
eukprot:jgi/Tetstr1/463947/TSEL_008752.t1